MKFADLLEQADIMQEKLLNQFQKVYATIKPSYLFIALLGLHLFSTSGAVYNMINRAPPYGMDHDKDGNEVMLLIDRGGHGQYSTEGLLAGLLTVCSSVFFIQALRTAQHENGTIKKIGLYLVCGLTTTALILMMYKIKR